MAEKKALFLVQKYEIPKKTPSKARVEIIAVITSSHWLY